MKDHKELDVWKKGIDLVVESYRHSGMFPKDELFGLTSQMRRAAVSIPSNIAEGAARNTSKEFVQFLHVALGSAAELETQFIIAKKLGYLEEIDGVLIRLAAVQQMLNGLIRHYRNKGTTGVR
ncbi:four helix bundle protein [Geobacter sp. AOG1]|uniref:four helix bundle protein n=1 Tax=Geobacter sp. AOG1 TaxID=1566346 RepID=UPI001CC65921|nr:four helix bundle protein [Geobacter sp. AOG1]GFE57767.1 hypothetical protein AOG1_16470 [Geobacter sp. AOG1]